MPARGERRGGVLILKSTKRNKKFSSGSAPRKIGPGAAEWTLRLLGTLGYASLVGWGANQMVESQLVCCRIAGGRLRFVETAGRHCAS